MLLCAWLVELKIGKMNKIITLKERNISPENAKLQKKMRIEQEQKLIEDFLTKYERRLDTNTIIQVLQNHGRLKDCLWFANRKV